MKREDEIKEEMLTFSIANMYRRNQLMQADMEQNGKDYILSILRRIDQIFQQVIVQQENGKKKNIEYMNFYFLHSSFLAGRYELEMEIYDNQFLFDKECITELIPVPLFGKYYEEDLCNYQSYMQQAVIQVRYHELYQYRMELHVQYQKLLKEMVRSLIPVVTSLVSFRDIKKNECLKIGFGEYMVTSEVLYQLDKDESI